MKIKTMEALPMLLLASVFVLSACNAFPAGISEPQIELPQVYEFPGFGYSIDYPAGWTASTRQAYTIINELEEEHQRAFSEGVTLEGNSIGFEHRSLDFLNNLD